MAKRPERGRDSSRTVRIHAHGPAGEELRADAPEQSPGATGEPADGGEGEGELMSETEPESGDEPETVGDEEGGDEDVDARHAEDLANAAQEEIAALRDQLLRLAADFDNFRKRSLREQKDAREYGTTQLLGDLLPVIDNLDRALVHSEGDDSPVTQGVRLVAKQFHDVLAKHGVTGFDSAGTPFDPERHEAVAQVPAADREPGTVVEELQRGYMLRGRLLRPARVVVATQAAAQGGQEKPD